MIIFDLDGVLANFDHRRHFIDVNQMKDRIQSLDQGDILWNEYVKIYKPNWKSFYECCDEDERINYTVEILLNCLLSGRKTQIWSGRFESVRKKTMQWLQRNLNSSFRRHSPLFEDPELKVKLRSDDDDSPIYTIKEKWLNERCSDLIEYHFEDKKYPVNHDIDYVFDSDPESIKMWKRRGIFVFDCNQKTIWN